MDVRRVVYERETCELSNSIIYGYGKWCNIMKRKLYNKEMFSNIETFISNNSYGPTAALISDVGSVRYVLIQPYNHYLFQTKKNIYLLRSSEEGDTSNKTTAIKINKTETKLVYVNYSRSFIQNIMERGYYKIMLDNSVTSLDMSSLINLCLSRGIFTL